MSPRCPTSKAKVAQSHNYNNAFWGSIDQGMYFQHLFQTISLVSSHTLSLSLKLANRPTDVMKNQNAVIVASIHNDHIDSIHRLRAGRL